jgi:uncharacterized repeat protein (TIGR03803 family)
MGLVRDRAGNLYGTTLFGGGGRCNYFQGCGTMFRLDASGHETILHAFTGGKDGDTPWATPVLDAFGNLYGATLYGGYLHCGFSSGCGAVFKLDPSGNNTILHAFASSAMASTPYGVKRDASGNIYGTTAIGGSGTVFKLDSLGNLSILHTFTGGTDGSTPYSGLVQDKAGNLFGTTYNGGTFNSGTLFKVDSVGKETVLYSFTGFSDGGFPIGALVQSGQYLYGTTSGVWSAGTIFKLDKSGSVTVVYSFTGGTDGGRPMGNLITDPSGNLYGTTFYGGSFGYGTAFKLNPTTGQYTVLYSFSGGLDGSGPSAGLVRDPAGNLYGTTLAGGVFKAGTVFKITP